HGDAHRWPGGAFVAPAVDELARRIDALELTDDEDHAAVGHAVADAIAPADAQVDLGLGTAHALRSPPALELGGLGPRREHALRRRGDGAPHDQGQPRLAILLHACSLSSSR